MKNYLKFRSRKIEGEAHGRFGVTVLAVLVIICRLSPFLILGFANWVDLIQWLA